jgi:hypothetical protein
LATSCNCQPLERTTCGGGAGLAALAATGVRIVSADAIAEKNKRSTSIFNGDVPELSLKILENVRAEYRFAKRIIEVCRLILLLLLSHPAIMEKCNFNVPPEFCST